jgi:hypothetical protein
MTVAGFVVAVVGLVLFALGYARARDPLRRYRDLRARDQNTARYRAWRGGPSSAAEEKTGASVAMEMLRRQARTWGAIAVAGVVLVVIGFVLASR